MRTRRRQHEHHMGAAAVAVLFVAEILVTLAAVCWALATHYRTPSPFGEVPQALPELSTREPLERSAHDLRRARSRQTTRRSSPPSKGRRSPVGTAVVPQLLKVPHLDIAARVVPVATDDGGALSVPSDVRQVGWWPGGAHPGSRTGTVVIDGHVDSASQGRGALFALSQAAPGDGITLTTNAGDFRYTVVALRAYPKSQLPPDVFARAGRPRLVLITCGGQFDTQTRHYRSNVVVYAVPDPT